jgi:phosphate transport system protein
MHTLRARFAQQLGALRDEVLQMGTMVEQALSRAMRSLEIWSNPLASQVIQDDSQIDELQHQLEEHSIKLIATQQPVAFDLRLIGSVYAMAAELERIGDYARHIARRMHKITSQPVLLTPPSDLFEMAALTEKMLSNSLESFLRQDVALAESLVKDYQRISEFEERLRRELIDTARSDPQRIYSIVDMLDVVHALERSAARTVNIAERVLYIETSSMEGFEAE